MTNFKNDFISLCRFCSVISHRRTRIKFFQTFFRQIWSSFLNKFLEFLVTCIGNKRWLTLRGQHPPDVLPHWDKNISTMFQLSIHHIVVQISANINYLRKSYGHCKKSIRYMAAKICRYSVECSVFKEILRQLPCLLKGKCVWI